LGGAGSNYVVALARLGIGGLAIADPDSYELANMNRQAGAMMSTLGRAKVEVMSEVALDINPELKIRQLPDRISPTTIDDFLASVDVVIDAIDGRDYPAHETLHERARSRGLFSILGGVPIGFGASLTTFGPGSVSFLEWSGATLADDIATRSRKAFAATAPASVASRYLSVGPHATSEHLQFSSISPTLYLCTALAVCEALCILLQRRPPTLAPTVLQVDLLMRAMSVSHATGSPPLLD
jgi:hypothetical protein